MTISVRPARAEDVQALVELRLANARRHVELDPCSYRLPDACAVRRHFEQVLSNSPAPTTTILVAEAAGKVAG